MAPVGITVPPELLRTTANKIENDLQHATAVVNAYLSHHESVVSAATFTGLAANASLNTAGQLHHDLGQTINGCNRLADGLRKTAALIEAHEDDGRHAFDAVFGMSAST